MSYLRKLCDNDRCYYTIPSFSPLFHITLLPFSILHCIALNTIPMILLLILMLIEDFIRYIGNKIKFIVFVIVRFVKSINLFNHE